MISKFKVGSVQHPMEEKHYIEWIEVVTGDGLMRKFLRPGDVPEAVFGTTDDNARAREYCSVHGDYGRQNERAVINLEMVERAIANLKI